MTGEELAALAARARAGDGAAHRGLLVELYAAVRKHVYLIVGSRAIADDAVQETMIALHRGLEKFRGDASPRTWALSIATRIAFRLRRREARYEPVEQLGDETALFDVAPQEAAELVMLRRALQTLAPKKRDAFVLMAIFEMSADEAGKTLGTFANTAASRYRHARAELEAHLKHRNFDEDPQVAATKRVRP